MFFFQVKPEGMKSSRPVSAQLVMELHRITGMGVMGAKHSLETADEPLSGRILEAIRLGGESGHLSDPLDHNSETAPLLRQADEKAAKELEGVARTLGFCHLFWITKKRILREEYGIEWFSPAEMNPGVFMD